MRYYSTQRPVGPGTFPRQDGKETITNFDGKTYCEEIGRETGASYSTGTKPSGSTVTRTTRNTAAQSLRGASPRAAWHSRNSTQP